METDRDDKDTDTAKAEDVEKTEDTPAPDERPETDGADAGGAEEATETADAEPRWKRRALIGGAAAVLVVALVGSGFLGWQLWQDRQLTRAGEQARAAAVDYAEILTSIDSSKVDENFAQVLDGATGEFKDMYSESSTQLRQLLIDNEASAHGVVVDSAVQSAAKDQVVVLLFVDQTVSNTNVPDPRIDRSRIKMTMEKAGDRWRASKVELR